VQEHAMAAWESETNFRQRVVNDARIKLFLDRDALEHTFDLNRQLRYVDALFARVFV
jgi:adenylosuccinate lyase